MRIMALVFVSPPPPLLFELAAAAARKGMFWLCVIGGLIAGLDIGGLKG